MPGNEIQKFDQLKADITIAIQPILALTAKDDESSKGILEAGRQTKAYAKRVEDLRKELTSPLNDEVKRINAHAKQITEPLDRAEAHIKGELLKWEKELERRRHEEFKRAEEKRLKAEAEAKARADEEREASEMAAMFSKPEEAAKVTAVADAKAEREISEIRNEHKTAVKDIGATKVSGIRKRWVFEVTDQSLVPREFLIVNEMAIRAAVNTGMREIAGIRIYEDTSISIR